MSYKNYVQLPYFVCNIEYIIFCDMQIQNGVKEKYTEKISRFLEGIWHMFFIMYMTLPRVRLLLSYNLVSSPKMCFAFTFPLILLLYSTNLTSLDDNDLQFFLIYPVKYLFSCILFWTFATEWNVLTKGLQVTTQIDIEFQSKRKRARGY